jgi:hypothetical protein
MSINSHPQYRMKKKSLTQRILSTNTITMADWLAMKPYNNPIVNYDNFYVKQCQTVLREFTNHQKWFDRNELSGAQVKELACQLVSYFEDYINEIGIWQAYIDTNEELYGYALPFYDLSNYDKTYINLEDIAFLIWHYVTKYSEEEYIINPDHDTILALAKNIFAHFENVMDDSPAIEFYDNFFTIPDTEHYFGFKTKMMWFSAKSYLLGVDLSVKLAIAQQELIDEAKKSNLEQSYVSAILYALLESYLYQKRSSYSALNGPEWFAKVARCAQKRKEEIIDLTYWIDGKFLLKEKQEKHFIFEHVLTNVRYTALIDSFQKTQHMKVTDDKAYNMHMVRWNDVYMLSGMMYDESLTPLKLKQYKTKQLETPWILPEKNINMMYETTQKMYDAFVEFHGSPLAIFENEAEREKANNEYMDFYHKKLTNEVVEPFEERAKKFQKKMGLTDESVVETKKSNKKQYSSATFFVKNVGSMFFGRVKELINMLKAKTLTEQEGVDLFVDITNGYAPPLCDYLLSEYGSQNLKFPTQNNAIDVAKHLPFYYRMNSPEEFDRSYPLITIVDVKDIE